MGGDPVGVPGSGPPTFSGCKMLFTIDMVKSSTYINSTISYTVVVEMNWACATQRHSGVGSNHGRLYNIARSKQLWGWRCFALFYAPWPSDDNDIGRRITSALSCSTAAKHDFAEQQAWNLYRVQSKHRKIFTTNCNIIMFYEPSGDYANRNSQLPGQKEGYEVQHIIVNWINTC